MMGLRHIALLLSIFAVFSAMAVGQETKESPNSSSDAKAVSFDQDILPLLQKSCLACHNESENEGQLVMESVEQLLAGGDSGPGVIPGDATESLLYQLAAHVEEPFMPPVDNDVGAKKLPPKALALLKSWIDQGAKEDTYSDEDQPQIEWQPIADEHASVLAAEVSPDGRWLATGRGNRLNVYSISEKGLSQTLVDDSISESHPESAHLDTVQSIAWSPSQSLLASGGYRVVKIWKRQKTVPSPAASPTASDLKRLGVAAEQLVDWFDLDASKRRLVIVRENGATVAKLTNTETQKELASIGPKVIHDDSVRGTEHRQSLLAEKLRVLKSDVDEAKKRKEAAEKDVTKATEEIKKAAEEVPKKKEALDKAKAAFDKFDLEFKTDKKKQTELANQIKDLAEQVIKAEDEQKTKLAESKKKAEQEKTQLDQQLGNKKKERSKLEKEQKTKQTEFSDSEKALERSKNAKVRLETSVKTRASEIVSAEQTVADHQSVVDDAAKMLADKKQGSPSAWVRVHLSSDESCFTLVNEAGHSARFSTSDGGLLSIELDDARGRWKLIKTLGDPNSPESPFADRVTSVAFRHDGKLLAIGGGEPSRSGELQLWNTSDWTQENVVEDIHSDVVYDIQFAPLGTHLVSCGADRMMKLINSETAKPIRIFEGHTGHVMGVSWRADGRTLATAGADQVVKVWDAKEGTQKKTISGFKNEITAVRYLGLENRLVFSTGKGEVHSRDSEGKGKKGFGRLTDYVHRVSCSRDGKIVAAAGTDRTVRVWDSQGKQLVEFQ